MTEREQTVRGVIFDWGGVMTGPLADPISAWLEADRIDRDSYAAAVRPWIAQAYGPDGTHTPVHALERGEMSDAEFEQLLAALLVGMDGAPVVAAGMLKRMFAGSRLEDQMLSLARELRANGIRTALLSNSWGLEDSYPRHLFGELFDEVVISGEVGMRKPEERIFQLALDRLALAPGECVFIDDVEGNTSAATVLGFAAILHTDPVTTKAALTALL